MLGSISDVIKCELCQGTLEVYPEGTMDDYAMIMNTNPNNIFETTDKLLNKYMVYKCTSCGSEFKYTYKDIEYRYRVVIMEKLLMLVAKGLMNDVQALSSKYFIYCGKCQGYDGRGSCPASIFDKCKIKGFPINEL